MQTNPAVEHDTKGSVQQLLLKLRPQSITIIFIITHTIKVLTPRHPFAVGDHILIRWICQSCHNCSEKFSN